MSIWFTSDTHFGHANIIRYCNRPFSSVEQMDDELIRRWNTVVGPEDTVYHLGDFAFGRGAEGSARKAAAKLHGKIHLVLGNHDEIATTVIASRFTSIQHYTEVSVQGQKIVLFHYGLRTWHHDLRGAWHLYGHSHAGLPPFGKSVDAGVDFPLWAFAPISFPSLKAWMDKAPIGKHPQFKEFTGGQDNA